MSRRSFFQPLIGMAGCLALLSVHAVAAEPEDVRIGYARALLAQAGRAEQCTLRVDAGIGHAEGFTIAGGTITGGGPAGVLYGTQEYLAASSTSGTRTERPDFPLRGTVLFLMKDGSYDYELTPQEFPWFYDRELLTRYFDYLFANRFNAIFLWSGNMFPSLVELPEYPDARTLSAEQLKANQEQFRWFTDECAKRNISVLTHFYNIHLTRALAKSRNIPMHYSAPDPFAAKFLHYTLVRFLTQFSSVGLYVCPGEALASKYQPEWIRDVILKAAVDSGRHPWVVVRDWGLPGQPFKDACHYDHLFTELKHNVEMLVSPVPDMRHAFWVHGQNKHIVNVHEASDIKPFRWASPLFIHEMVQEWQKAGLDGAEVYGRVSWRWPYTLDKLTPQQVDIWPEGPKWVTFERDALWLEAFGRYLWKVERDPAGEAAHWADALAKRFGSPEAGQALYTWYNLTGPILPGLQNLTSVNNMNFFPTAVGKEQMVDDILSARVSIAQDIQNNQHRLTDDVAMGEHYPSRPVDSYFLDRYRTEYQCPALTNRYTMPAAEYAQHLAKGEVVADSMTPDRVADLLVKLAHEAEPLARRAAAAATRNQDDAERYISDTQAMRLIAEYYRAKVRAAIEKRCWQLTNDDAHAEPLRKLMDDSLLAYERLVVLTDRTYIRPTDMAQNLNWHNGLRAAERDVRLQKRFAAYTLERKRPGVSWIEAEEMEGNWKLGHNYRGYSGTGFRVPEDAAQRATELTSAVEVREAGKYAVWARGLIGGATPDRAFQVKVNGTTFAATHGERGQEGGEFVWHHLGDLELAAGAAQVSIKPAGKGFVCPDVLVLAKDIHWQPPDAR